MTEENRWEKVEQDLWIPEGEGDSIEGVYLNTEHEVGTNKSNLYSIEVSTGNVEKFWGSKIIDSNMIGIKPGEVIKIVFNGKVKKEGKNEYKDFEVFRERPTEKPETEEPIEPEVPIEKVE